MSATPLLQVQDLQKHYPVRGGILGRTVGVLRAVAGVSFELLPGQTLGLVGESGCGKSTLGRTLMRLEEPTSGQVLFDGQDMAHARGDALLKLRREVQMVFQDPYSSLNPRMTVGEIVREPLVVHGIGDKAGQRERVRTLLETVGLAGDAGSRYPSEFSGGQRQRIGVARALALDPRLVIADEPVSALDVSVQSQVLNLMVRLQRERGLAYIFISHDLSVVQHVSDHVAIMYLGRIVEMGPVQRIFEAPAHPYTRALMQAIPSPDPRRRRDRVPLQGETPSPTASPGGCAFASRCPHVHDRCRLQPPVLQPLDDQAPAATRHVVACLRQAELPAFDGGLHT
ncbi:MAG: ABC transporter ATP-binding protein [Betaproteobacteria bacterium]|nr:dipeptide ABC transporter ATP-binding protein [Burkholderiaceae bacterium]MCZ8110180.1 dipeptide ABC transporter ATP-binding protein [Rubrivivax sp.]MCZ8177292.1 dipeptide ABC transporter ATP-binding protein [Burkholderiaceae bacterium]